MLKPIAFACLVVMGCKADKPEPAAGTATETSGTTAQGGPTRSGKIDLGLQRPNPSNTPSAAEPESEGEDSISDRRKARMAAIDTDGDGNVTGEERKAARARRAVELRAQLDADKDGKVTPAELASSRFRRFDPESVDANKDGDVSVDEIAQALEARSRAWGMGRFRAREGGSGAGSGQ
jgi:hypothetical protein